MAPFPWSLVEIKSRVGRGQLSPERILDAAIDAIARRDPSIRAWACLTLPEARRRATALSAELRRSGPRSALHGVPLAVKDIFDTEGTPTEWGSATQRGRVPARDCELVARLLDCGCVLLGKTHTTAFAYFDPAPTRNPHDPQHTPGGSSSGSAAAVAAGMAPLAVGSQTQGSVLRPASFCGVVGFKPSFGRLPLGGVMPFARSLDHAGLFAASVQDVGVAWQGLGFGTEPAAAEEILVVDWPPAGGVEAPMAKALSRTVQLLSAGGLRVRSARCPAFFAGVPDALQVVMAREAAQEHGHRLQRHGALMGARLSKLLEAGQAIAEEPYREALEVLAGAREAYDRWTGPRRVLATPAAPGPAPADLSTTGDPRCNAPFTAVGAPAVSIPMPTAVGSLPVGLQLTACRGNDALLLATAAKCEHLLRESRSTRHASM